MRSPNILLIMADQLTAKALPMYGHKIVKAPNLVRLAERSAVFSNAYCNFPICAPSRYSMLTGRLAHSIGAFDNASEFSAATPTIAHYLDNLGYRTTLCGKMHFVGPDQLHGFQERLITDIYPANFAWVPDWTEGPTNAPTGIERELRKRIFSGWNPEELNKTILQSQAERRVICDAMNKPRGRLDNWSYIVGPHDAERFVRGGGESGGTVAVKGRARFPYVPPAAS